MERIFLLVLVVAIVAIGIAAGGAALFQGTQDHWSPREYVAKDGDCFVPPQGDPLYDEHYARNVNVPNCGALKTQSEAKNIDAETREVNTRTNQSVFYSALVGVIFLGVVGFFVYAVLK